MGANAGNNNSNPVAALLGPQGAAGGQQRDGSNNPSTTGAESGVPDTNPLPNPWNNTPRGTRITSAPRRLPPLRDLGTLPELDQMLGGALDPPSLSQMMQNPELSPLIQSVLSDPELTSQILNMNPELRGMTESNPQLQQMMQDPELLRQLANPETMQQTMSLQQPLFSTINRSQTNTDPSQTGGAAVNANMGLETLVNMFGGLGTGGLAAQENSNGLAFPLLSEDYFATQLTQLQEMGFFDAQENLRALVATRGNVHAAVDRLLGNMGQ